MTFIRDWIYSKEILYIGVYYLVIGFACKTAKHYTVKIILVKEGFWCTAMFLME